MSQDQVYVRMYLYIIILRSFQKALETLYSQEYRYYSDARCQSKRLARSGHIKYLFKMQGGENQESGQVSPQSYKQMVIRQVQVKYPFSVKLLTNQDIVFNDVKEIEQLMNSKEQHKNSQGRGGNNVSENVKKAIRSLLRKRLPEELFREYQERYVSAYNLKSQKENYILYFLFLFEMAAQRKLEGKVIEQMIEEIRAKIKKYAQNSEKRIQEEPDRQEFHEKNLLEFSKFIDIDLDFSKPRRYAEIKASIKQFYLKKDAVFRQAERKVRRIIQQHPLMEAIFVDWKQEGQEVEAMIVEEREEMPEAEDRSSERQHSGHQEQDQPSSETN